MRNETVLESFYHDAYIHTEDKKIFNVHKVILATQSPFLHNYFQSRPGHDVNDVYFQNTHSSIVKAAVELIYNGNVSIETDDLKSFKWFVENLLGVNLRETEEKDNMSKSEKSPNQKPQGSTASPDTIPEQTDEKINVNSDKDSCILPPIDTADYDKEDSANEMTSSFRSAWTLTSINTVGLNQIRHSYKHVDRKGRLYKCDVCKKITRTFDDASQHFMLKHQNCESEREKIEDAMNARQKCLTKISSIKEDVKRGCNEAMAMSQLNLVTQELTKHLNLLCDFDRAKRLPEGLSRKTKELCRALDETIKEVDIIVKQSENKMLK